MATPYTERKTGAPLRTVLGVRFACWHVGLMKTEWRSANGSIRVSQNSRMTEYVVSVCGVQLVKKFRKLDNAMRAGVGAYETGAWRNQSRD